MNRKFEISNSIKVPFHRFRLPVFKEGLSFWRKVKIIFLQLILTTEEHTLLFSDWEKAVVFKMKKNNPESWFRYVYKKGIGKITQESTSFGFRMASHWCSFDETMKINYQPGNQE